MTRDDPTPSDAEQRVREQYQRVWDEAEPPCVECDDGTCVLHETNEWREK